MRFEIIEMVKMLGKRIEIVERPLQDAQFFENDTSINSMDDKLKHADGYLEAVRHARPGEIHLLIQSASKNKAQGPDVFRVFEDANVFYELTVYNEASTSWKHQTT